MLGGESAQKEKWYALLLRLWTGLFFYNSLLDGSEEGWMYLTVHIFGLVEAALTQFLYSFHRPACLVFHAKEKAPHEAVNKFFSVYVCIFFVVFLLSLSFI